MGDLVGIDHPGFLPVFRFQASALKFDQTFLHLPPRNHQDSSQRSPPWVSVGDLTADFLR